MGLEETNMIGNTFWDDLGIDAYEIQIAIEAQAKTLVDHWGKELTETDLLKLKAYSDSLDNPIETAFAQKALAYYQTQDYQPEFIHSGMSNNSITKRWWQFWKR